MKSPSEVVNILAGLMEYGDPFRFYDVGLLPLPEASAYIEFVLANQEALNLLSERVGLSDYDLKNRLEARFRLGSSTVERLRKSVSADRTRISGPSHSTFYFVPYGGAETDLDILHADTGLASDFVLLTKISLPEMDARIRPREGVLRVVGAMDSGEGWDCGNRINDPANIPESSVWLLDQRNPSAGSRDWRVEVSHVLADPIALEQAALLSRRHEDDLKVALEGLLC